MKKIKQIRKTMDKEDDNIYKNALSKVCQLNAKSGVKNSTFGASQWEQTRYQKGLVQTISN